MNNQNARILHSLALKVCESYLHFRVAGNKVILNDHRSAQVHAQNTLDDVCTIWVPWKETGFGEKLKSTPHVFVTYDSVSITVYLQETPTDDDYKMQMVGRDEIALIFDRSKMKELCTIKENEKLLLEFHKHSNARRFNLESTNYHGR